MVRQNYDCLGKRSAFIMNITWCTKKKKHCDYYENYLVHKKESWKHYEHYGSPKKFLHKIMNLLGTQFFFSRRYEITWSTKNISQKSSQLLCTWNLSANILRRFCLLSGVLVVLWWTRNDSSKVIGNCNGLHKILWWLNYPLWSYPLLWLQLVLWDFLQGDMDQIPKIDENVNFFL